MFLRNQSIRLRFQNQDKLSIFINRMNKSEMNLENTEPIVDRNDPDFLWHSNNALRKELEKTKKHLQVMEMKWNNAYWSKR